jgi:hypothetical protein
MKPEPTEEQIQAEADRIIKNARSVFIARGCDPKRLNMYIAAERWRAVREARANLTSPCPTNGY